MLHRQRIGLLARRDFPLAVTDKCNGPAWEKQERSAHRWQGKRLQQLIPLPTPLVLKPYTQLKNPAPTPYEFPSGIFAPLRETLP